MMRDEGHDMMQVVMHTHTPYATALACLEEINFRTNLKLHIE